MLTTRRRMTPRTSPPNDLPEADREGPASNGGSRFLLEGGHHVKFNRVGTSAPSRM